MQVLSNKIAGTLGFALFNRTTPRLLSHSLVRCYASKATQSKGTLSLKSTKTNPAAPKSELKPSKSTTTATKSTPKPSPIPTSKSTPKSTDKSNPKPTSKLPPKSTPTSTTKSTSTSTSKSPKPASKLSPKPNSTTKPTPTSNPKSTSKVAPKSYKSTPTNKKLADTKPSIDYFPEETVAKPQKVKETKVKGVSVAGTNVGKVPEEIEGNATAETVPENAEENQEEEFDIDEYEDEDYEDYGEDTYYFFKKNVEKLGPKAHKFYIDRLHQLFTLEQSPSAMRIFGFMLNSNLHSSEAYETMVLGYLNKGSFNNALSFLKDMHERKYSIKESILDAFVNYLANNPSKKEEGKFNEALQLVRSNEHATHKSRRRPL